MPTIVSIHLAPGRRLPVKSVDEVQAEAGKGLVGDRYHGTKHRHVSVQSASELAGAAERFGQPIDPAGTRRNLTLSDGDVPREPGARLRIGDVLLEVVRVAAPCRLLDDNLGPGAAEALRRRAGSICRILEGGTLRVGDEVELRPARRTDSAARVVGAPAAAVFAALVDPDALVQWLPPSGMSGRFTRFDPRPGGGYQLELSYDDPATAQGKTTAGSDLVEARYVDIVPDVRVVQAVDFVSDDPAFAGTMTMTWELSAADAGTLVELRAEDVPSGISAEDHAAGMASSLANLATYVEDRAS